MEQHMLYSEILFEMDHNRLTTLYPTYDQLKDFQSLVENFEVRPEIESVGAFKIKAPVDISTRHLQYTDLKNLTHNMAYSRKQTVTCKGSGLTSLQCPIEISKIQSRKRSGHGSKTIENLSIREFQGMGEPNVLFGDFYKIAERDADVTVSECSFWSKIQTTSPYYATGDGSLFDNDTKLINLNRLNTILQQASKINGEYPGITTSWNYIGPPMSHFPLHCEDSLFHSVNYVHHGKPKIWYVIPPEEGENLQEVAAGLYPDEAKKCCQFLQHKNCLIPPQVLSDYGIRFNKITQQAGEYMVLLPFTYHQGFNEGLNVSEAVNFVTQKWIDDWLGCFQPCQCGESQGVKISFDEFFKLKNEKNFIKMCGTNYSKFVSRGSDNQPKPKKNKEASAAEFEPGPTPRPLSDFLRNEQQLQPASSGRRSNLCPYCRKQTVHLKTHVIKKHMNEHLVVQLIDADKNGNKTEARRLVQLIKGDGTLLFNNSKDVNHHEEFVPSRRPRQLGDARDYVTCRYCKNAVLRTNKRHECYSKLTDNNIGTVRERVQYSQLLENQFNQYLSEESKLFITNKKQDELWHKVISDDVIAVFLNDMIKEGLGEGNTIRYVRLLAAIVKGAEGVNNEIRQVKDLLTSQYRDVLTRLLTDESTPTGQRKQLRTILKRLAQLFTNHPPLQQQVGLSVEEMQFLKLLGGI